MNLYTFNEFRAFKLIPMSSICIDMFIIFVNSSYLFFVHIFVPGY